VQCCCYASAASVKTLMLFKIAKQCVVFKLIVDSAQADSFFAQGPVGHTLCNAIDRCVKQRC